MRIIVEKGTERFLQSKVAIGEYCTVQFLPDQPIKARCVSIDVDLFERFNYGCELFLTTIKDLSEEDLERGEKTYIENVQSAFIYPLK